MLDEFFGQFLQTFGLPIVSQDLVVHERLFLFDKRGFDVLAVPLTPVLKDKNREPSFNEALKMEGEFIVFINEVEVFELR
jgi:hypothetical protein